MSNLVTGTVVLVVGGIATDDTQVLTTIGNPNVSIADGQVTGNIPANVAQSIQNGFYLMMTSNTTDGNSVINYSNRFTLIEMSGTTDGQVLNGATTQAGSVSNVPAAQYNVIEHPTPSSAAPTATATATTETATANSTATSDPFPGDGDGGHLSGPMLAGVIAGSILAAIGAISLVIGQCSSTSALLAKNENKRRKMRYASPSLASGTRQSYLGTTDTRKKASTCGS